MEGRGKTINRIRVYPPRERGKRNNVPLPSSFSDSPLPSSLSFFPHRLVLSSLLPLFFSRLSFSGFFFFLLPFTPLVRLIYTFAPRNTLLESSFIKIFSLCEGKEKKGERPGEGGEEGGVCFILLNVFKCEGVNENLCTPSCFIEVKACAFSFLRNFNERIKVCLIIDYG